MLLEATIERSGHLEFVYAAFLDKSSTAKPSECEADQAANINSNEAEERRKHNPLQLPLSRTYHAKLIRKDEASCYCDEAHWK